MAPRLNSNPDVKIEVVELAIEPRWYVRVAFPDGEQTYVGGFISEIDALEWVKTKSSEWLKQYSGGKYAYEAQSSPD
jgi:hypothetical protein